MTIDERKKLPIQFSCYFARSSSGEQFTPEHTISFVYSGLIELYDGEKATSFKAGDLYFCRRNNLMKFSKTPLDGQEFRSVSIYFDQPALRKFSLEQDIKVQRQLQQPIITPLSKGTLLYHYMHSILEYEAIFKQNTDFDLIELKQKEAIILLLKTNQDLQDILFDFSDPGKIDLEAFMNRNYHFNVKLDRFAYLSGRSLSTFKRDFQRIFRMSPSKWLLDRRLREAYYLIKEQQKRANDIYLMLGFEDLSHFSYAFKKQFGTAPSYL